MSTFDHATIALISRQHVVEVLAQLTEGPHTLRTLHRSCPGTRRELHDALRALAAAGAIRRTSGGSSWDTRRGDGSAYTFTTAGYRLVEQLSDIDAWTNAYQRSLDQPAPQSGGR